MLQPVQLLFAYIFILGLFVGSFLNALIDRLATGESLVTSTRSHCDSCQKKLKAFDLV
ncbi:prepilin peptidase, partial [candidate division WWE3 bacterium]|nr:prepilin peptidase [candidate division WWE3 bacterium]